MTASKPILMVFNPVYNRWEELYSYSDITKKSDMSVAQNNSNLIAANLNKDYTSNPKIIIPNSAGEDAYGENTDNLVNHYTKLSDVCVPVENAVKTPLDLTNNKTSETMYVTPNALSGLMEAHDGLNVNPQIANGGPSYSANSSTVEGSGTGYFIPTIAGTKNGQHLVWHVNDNNYYMKWEDVPETTSQYTRSLATFKAPASAVRLGYIAGSDSNSISTSMSTADHFGYVSPNNTNKSVAWPRLSEGTVKEKSTSSKKASSNTNNSRTAAYVLSSGGNNDYIYMNKKSHTYVFLLNSTKVAQVGSDFSLEYGCIKINNSGSYLISFQADCWTYKNGANSLTSSSNTNIHFSLQKKHGSNWSNIGVSNTSHVLGIGSHTIGTPPCLVSLQKGDYIRLVGKNDSNHDSAIQSNHSQTFITIEKV